MVPKAGGGAAKAVYRGREALLDNPIAWAALLCFLLGLALSGLARLVPVPALTSLVAPTVFLASYVLTYQQVPPFPPVGATNKIFYIALAAALVGFVLDVSPRTANFARPLAWILSFAIVGWIGLPRLFNGDFDAILTSLALAVSGGLVLWRLYAVGTATAAQDGGGLVGLAILMALVLGFAPVALLGGSSTSTMLCLAAFAGFGAIALWQLALPRQAVAASAVLGAGGGLQAVVATVTLITRQADLVALALLLLIPYAGQVGARFVLPPNRIRGRLRQVLVGLLAASPVALVAAILLLRHPESVPS